MSQRRSMESSSACVEDSGSPVEDDDKMAVVTRCGGAECLDNWQLATLLEHLCSIYVPDQQSSLHEQVFQLLYRQLQKIKISTRDMKDARNIHRQCSADFNELVKDALNMMRQPMTVTLSADIQQRLGTLLNPRNFPVKLTVPMLDTSRFTHEFAKTRSLGKGGFGEVFNVKHKLDNWEYAVKQIYVCDTESELSRIMREAYFLAELSHVNVIRYYQVWVERNIQAAAREPNSEITVTRENSDDGIVFEAETGGHGNQMGRNQCAGQQEDIAASTSSSSADCGDSSTGSWGSSERSVMENASVILHIQMELCLKTLADWLEERNRQKPGDGDEYSLVKEDRCRRFMREMLEGVKYIHSKKIIHRDLKPENIFLVGDEEDLHVKIGDFGLSRRDTQNMPNTSRQETVAEGGDMAYTKYTGTKSYAAPELETTNYSTKADMFSMGFMMFELYQPLSSVMEKDKTFKGMRNKQLSDQFTKHWPNQARCILRLVGEPDERPTAEEVIPEVFLQLHEERLEVIQKRKVDDLQEDNKQLKQTITQRDGTIARQGGTIARQEEQISQQQKEILKLQMKILQLGQE